MAIFKIDKLLDEEGGYVNNTHDTGGETYAGVSRKNFPKWSGWVIVDRYKKIAHTKKELNQLLSKNSEIQKAIYQFYKTNFWDKVKGDDIHSEKIAMNIFDFAVNAGVERSIKIAQKVLGLVQDGVIGEQTIKALNVSNEMTFVKSFIKERKDYYKELVKIRPEDEVFLNGWLDRADKGLYA